MDDYMTDINFQRPCLTNEKRAAIVARELVEENELERFKSLFANDWSLN